MENIVSPEKLSQQGKSLYQKGDFLEAAKVFQAAEKGFLEQNDRITAAEMANNASVAFLQAHDATAAYFAAEGTAEVFSDQKDYRRHGMAMGNLAAAAEALGNNDEAIELYVKAAELLSHAGEDQLRASVMQSLSMLQLKTGRQLQALATMQNGLEGVRRPTAKQSFIKKLLHIPMNMISRGKP